MSRLARPTWSKPWNGDPSPLLDAAEAAGELLTKLGIEWTVRVDINWEGNSAHEDTIQDGRDALRDAHPPKSLSVQLWQVSPDAGVRHVDVSAIAGQLMVTATGTDIALTERVFASAQTLAVSGAAAPPADRSVSSQRIRFSIERPWKQWAGSLDGLASAARLAADELAGWDPHDEDEYHWGVDTEITVVERSGLTTNLADPAELPSVVDPRDVANIKSIVIDVSRLRPRSRVTLIANASLFRNGMELTVGGQDRTRVDGLMVRLANILAPRERVGWLLSRLWWLNVAGYIFLISFLGVGLLLKYAFDVPAPARVVLGAAAGIALALAAGLLASASPTLEVLAPGRTPRFQRWRAKVFAGVGALVLGVIGSIIATVIYSGD